MTGWIKMHRSMLDWEWYSDLPVRVLFMHLLMTVNYEPKRWCGREIQPGQIATSLPKLSAACGLTVQQIRTALNKLKTAGEVTDESTNEHRIITVAKWSEYQGKQQANNKQATGEQHQLKKERNNSSEDKSSSELSRDPKIDFEEFWKSWKPHEMQKGDKPYALKRYVEARKKTTHANLMAKSAAYCADCARLGSKTQHVSTWVNREGWESVEDRGPPSAADKPLDPEEAYKNAKFRRKMGILRPADEDLIQQYEAQHAIRA